MSDERLSQVKAALRTFKRRPPREWEIIEMRLVISLLLEFLEKTGQLDEQNK